MKKTQFKDTRRNISKQFVSYLSIIVVAMLSVAAYLGINFASDAMIANASRYLEKLDFRDIDVSSTMLLTDEDIDALKNVEGVSDVEGVYQTSARLFSGDKKEPVSVISITERISRPEITEGRLPKNSAECAVEEEMMEQLGLKVGDKVTICGSDGSDAPYLRYSEFLVTGRFFHADHYAWKTYSAGDRYVLVTDDCFDTDALDGCFMRAVVKLDRPSDIGVIGKAYDRLSAEGVSRINAVADERAPLREAAMKKKYAESIEENEEKLKEAKKELDKAQEEIAENEQKIADGESELEKAWNQLELAKRRLTAAESKLKSGRAELDAGRAKLDSARSQLDDAASQLADGWNQIEAKKTQVRSNIQSKTEELLREYAPDYAGVISWAGSSPANVNDPSLNAAVFRITDSVSVNILEIPADLDQTIGRVIHWLLDDTSYADRVDMIIGSVTDAVNESPLTQAISAVTQWNDAHEDYLAGRADYLAGESEYSDALERYKKGLAEYNKGFADYEEGLRRYNAAAAELEEGRRQLSEGKKEFAKGMHEYKNGMAELQKAKDTIAGLNPCRWIVLDAYGSAAYVHAKSSADNIRKMAMTFALLFVLIAALVIYATVARIIDEQRNQLGTVKALGLYDREAAVKYLVFGISATVIGIVLGALAGYFVIQRVALMSHEDFYVTGGIPNSFNLPMTITALAAGLLIASLAVWSACSELVRLPAVELMKEKMPAFRGKASTDKQKSAGLYSRLIVRNMRNDSRRAIVTMISVAGCCALLVIGFTMKSGIMGALDEQYGRLIKYDQAITFDPEVSDEAEERIRKLLDENDCEYTGLYRSAVSFSAGNELVGGELICGDEDDIAKNLELIDKRTGKQISPAASGLYITRRVAKYYGLKAGDAITLYDNAMMPHTVAVAGIYEYYFGLNIVMSKKSYKEVFGRDAPVNCFLVRNIAEESVISRRLMQISGFEGIESTHTLYDNSDKAAATLNMIIAVLILAAGLLACFILLNLANMYINQKKRELTVMRINGFSTKEVIAYVAREAALTTVFGILLGVAAGALFGYAILRFVEQRQAGFVLTPDPRAWLYSALITAVYSFVIYAIALRRVKYLRLTDMA